MQTTPTLAEMLAIFVDSMIVAIQSASHDDERTLATCQDIEAEVCATYGVEIVCETLAVCDPFGSHWGTKHWTDGNTLFCASISEVVTEITNGPAGRDLARLQIDRALWNLSNSGYSHSI